MRRRLRQTDTPRLTDARFRASFRNAGWPYQASGIADQVSAGIFPFLISSLILDP
jgi:hypothetical protein